jgi:hypothetical protein
MTQICKIYIYSQSCPSSHLYKAVTCIRRSHFSFAVIENFIWIKPILRGHLSYKATFSSSWGWPLYTGLTIVNVTSYVISVINCEECQANEYNGLDVKWAF